MAASTDYIYGESGFLVINLTGGTDGGRVVLRLTDIELAIENDVDETLTMDANWNKVYNQTFTNWTIDCSGVLSHVTGETEYWGVSSGDSNIVGTINGVELIEVAKDRATVKHAKIKITTGEYQGGHVMVSSMNISASVGEKYTYSLSLQGSGPLTRYTS